MNIRQYGLCVLLAVASNSIAAVPERSISPGHYLALAADCAACHTAEKGTPFAGGLKMDTPIGAIYSTNITPDAQTGIGQYSYQDFARALREGKARNGHYLYPAMPYTAFSKFDDQQLHDLYAYFTQEVPAVRQANRKSDIPWPLNIRWPLWVWNMMFHDDERYLNDPLKSAEWNRGAWLVMAPGHCGSCHTPRGIAMQEKGLDHNDSAYLSGGTINGWHAPDLRGNNVRGLGSWTQQDIINFLKTGQNDRTMAFGSMADVVQQSTQHLKPADLSAIAVFLKSLPPGKFSSSPASEDYAEAQYPGAALYQDNCAACHRSDGRGYTHTFPALASNPALLGDDPSSLVSMILHGGRAAVTERALTGMRMPGFGWRLTDQQVAELSNYVRNSWGNQASDVTAEQVKKLRKGE